jgi:hypothetical protein
MIMPPKVEVGDGAEDDEGDNSSRLLISSRSYTVSFAVPLLRRTRRTYLDEVVYAHSSARCVSLLKDKEGYTRHSQAVGRGICSPDFRIAFVAVEPLSRICCRGKEVE